LYAWDGNIHDGRVEQCHEKAKEHCCQDEPGFPGFARIATPRGGACGAPVRKGVDGFVCCIAIPMLSPLFVDEP